MHGLPQINVKAYPVPYVRRCCICPTTFCWLWKTNMCVFGLQQYVVFKTLYMARPALYAYTSCPWNCASQNVAVWSV